MLRNSKDLKIGIRVRVKTLNQKGTVFYVDWKYIYAHHTYPVQVELDDPYDESGQLMYRTSIKDLKVIRKGRKK